MEQHKSKEDNIKFVIENKDVLIAQKKAEMKRADGVCHYKVNDRLIDINKSDISQIDLINTNALNVKAIINTTNIMDSHDDVHIPGLWTKTLQENNNIMHLQEHVMSFDSIISSGVDLSAYTKFYDWKDLGYEYSGQTQALEFESIIKKSRNEFMFKQYANNYVNNHSVGMRYVKIYLAVSDEYYTDEYDIWKKYINQIINAELAIDKGYFYAVTEARIIEGSAVPIGSNTITPTRSVTPKMEELELELNEQKNKIKLLKEILNDINKPQIEPDNSTLSTYSEVDFLKQINNNLSI